MKIYSNRKECNSFPKDIIDINIWLNDQVSLDLIYIKSVYYCKLKFYRMYI